MTPKESAQAEAEITFNKFIWWCKRAGLWSGLLLAVVVVGCNNGVETGNNKTGSQYNGEVYAPRNIKN